MMKKEAPTILNRAKLLFSSPVGVLELIEDEYGISGLSFGASSGQEEIPEKETPLLLEARRQLLEYFEGTRKEFDLPISLSGTEFQKKVWEELCRIPYGETRSYGEIASEIGCPGGSRAVGMANRRNPAAILVPCHRVIGADGSLTGYAGKNKALHIKAFLLELEGALPDRKRAAELSGGKENDGRFTGKTSGAC